jgi:hypothetical protein
MFRIWLSREGQGNFQKKIKAVTNMQRGICNGLQVWTLNVLQGPCVKLGLQGGAIGRWWNL